MASPTTPAARVPEAKHLLPRRPLPPTSPLVQSNVSDRNDTRGTPQESHRFGEQPPHSQRYIRWWRLEVTWAITMLATLVALFVLLYELDNQEARSWGFLTLNTIVAILTTILSSSMVAIVSACLSQSLWNWAADSPAGNRLNRPRRLKDLHIFDSASRGPLGGLRLIWRLHAWHPTSLGALIVVLNLGLGAFTQQLVSLETRLLPNGVAPGMPRSERFQSVPFGDLPRLSNPQDADVNTKAAVYNAAVGGNITEVLPACVTGNCTYPPTPTLAMCGECTDLSSALNNTGPCDTSESYVCGYQLPNGATLTYNAEHAANDSWVIFNITTVNPTALSGTRALVYNKTDRLYATAFNTIGLSPKTAFPNHSPTDSDASLGQVLPPMQAYECALWWCLQTYEISIDTGVTTKTLVKTWSEVATERQLQENFTNIPPEMNVEDGATYGIAYADQAGVRNALGAITLNNFEAYVQLVDTDGLAQFGPHDTRTPYDITSDVIQGVWQGSENFHDGNGTGWIDKMALSLSRNIALASPASDNTAYQGTSRTPKSFFVVRWPYIAFPVALVALCLVFWFWTVLETRRKAIRPWRVGILALLLMRVDEDVHDLARQAHALDRPNGFDDIGKIELRLRQRGNGDWGFERVLPRQDRPRK